jgi:hypothetical protein
MTVQVPFTNDACANAYVVQVGNIYEGSNVGATQDAATGCGYLDLPDVWFSYTPTTGGTTTVSLCGSDFDTTLSIYSGSCPGGQLACNDNFCGAQSSLTGTITPGTTLLIRVSGYNGATGNYVLRITQ